MKGIKKKINNKNIYRGKNKKMDKEILCICGRKGVGKDTLTE